MAMSGPFSTLAIPASGIATYKTWIDALADNVSNVSTVRGTGEAAFQERFILAQAKTDASGNGAGVEVEAAAFGDPNGRLVYEPSHPLADANGNVRYPDMDMTEQMTRLMVAQRSYQLNVSVFQSARDAYAKALEIGR
jgi:flagellar basal-body rod protein FlgC